MLIHDRYLRIETEQGLILPINLIPYTDLEDIKKSLEYKLEDRYYLGKKVVEGMEETLDLINNELDYREYFSDKSNEDKIELFLEAKGWLD